MDCQLELMILRKGLQLEQGMPTIAIKVDAEKEAGNSNIQTLNAHNSYRSKLKQAIFSK